MSEAGRATEDTAERFVPPGIGILEEAASRRHQLVYGRRGVGKSTLLHRVAALGGTNNRGVIFIDVETLRRRPYPDVLIELLRDLLANLEQRLAQDADGWRQRRARKRLRKDVLNLADSMAQLLEAPQSAEHTVRELRLRSRQSSRGWQARVRGRLSTRDGGPASADAEAGASASSESRSGTESQAVTEARFVKTKMEGLHEAASLIRRVLKAAQEELDVPTLVVLDDFYHVPRDDQPEVLAYLHQVVKGLDIHLKVCGVKHRLNPYRDGDPPVGLEPEHDAGIISLDITLERFSAAKEFLERVLEGVCTPLGIEVDDLLTDGGRDRLVLGSGGVARDYLALARRALRNSNERPAHQFRPRNRINAEDVAEAAVLLYEQKQEELKKDAGDDAEALRQRLDEIVEFCLDALSTNVFLVEVTKLQEERWGEQVQALADLRFVYRIATLSTKRGGETYPGRKFAAFTLDLSTWTSTRSEQITQIPFWEREGRQQLRSHTLIYTPERAAARGAESGEAAATLDEDEQLTFEIEEPSGND